MTDDSNKDQIDYDEIDGNDDDIDYDDLYQNDFDSIQIDRAILNVTASNCTYSFLN